MILGDVNTSGKTLSEDGTIQFANDLDDASVKLVNESKIPLTVKDADGNTLAEDLGKTEGVTFSEGGDGVTNLQVVKARLSIYRTEDPATAGIFLGG